jgi:flagellar export protein FliJ
LSWMESLLRVRNFEVELLRKRLAVILLEKNAVESQIDALDAEREREAAYALQHPESMMNFRTYSEHLKRRKADAQARAQALSLEEVGCRDALLEAFTEVKKIENLAEAKAEEDRLSSLRIESAELDAIAARKASLRG